jgi:hypothetical protein
MMHRRVPVIPQCQVGERDRGTARTQSAGVRKGLHGKAQKTAAHSTAMATPAPTSRWIAE